MKPEVMVAFAALLIAMPAFAAGGPADPMPRFERSGGGFSCHMSAEDYKTSETAQRDVCMRIGPLSILMDRTGVEKLLGKPTTSLKVGAREVFMYGLQSDATRLVVTYVVVAYAPDGHVNSIQLTGKPWTGAWRFCGLTLGDKQEALKERLGTPMQVEESDDPGAKQWSYHPWAFSFEVKAGVISSIRVAYE